MQWRADRGLYTRVTSRGGPLQGGAGKGRRGAIYPSPTSPRVLGGGVGRRNAGRGPSTRVARYSGGPSRRGGLAWRRRSKGRRPPVKAPHAPSGSREAAGACGSGLARPVSSSISTPAAPAARCSSQALASGYALFARSGLRPWCNPISGGAQHRLGSCRDPRVTCLFMSSLERSGYS